MNSTDKRQELISQLIQRFRASLDRHDEEELEAFVDAIDTSVDEAIAQVHGLRAPNNSSVLLLNPSSTQEEAVTGLQLLTQWLEDNWDEVRRRGSIAPGFRVPAAPDTRMLN